jgi:3',5'-cyclic AMP phosphodiesterase CpdA
MSIDSRPLRLIHVSDVHFWRYAFNPLQLFSKRLLGMASLVVRRARKFRLERVEEVVDRVLSLNPDHILVTGDLTTTALPAEFRAALRELGPWLQDPQKTTIIPGNHDRYTLGAHRGRRFEQYFGEFAPAATYPWLRFLDADTAILGLDPTRPGLTARGRLPEPQLELTRELITGPGRAIRRLIVACHYPVEVPPPYRQDLVSKNLINAESLGRWLATIGPHLYCCGHVHATWAFLPDRIPGQLCLNPGAPLLRDLTGRRPPGFLEILMTEHDVVVNHHAWTSKRWDILPLYRAPSFFPATSSFAS